jgi:hypothetical protein
MLYDSPQAVKPFLREFNRIWLRISKFAICCWTQSHYLGFSNAVGEDIKYRVLDEYVTEDIEM